MDFQIVDILSDDKPNGKNGKDFVITIYGKSDKVNELGKNKTVVCHVTGFKPYFYLKIPTEWKRPTVEIFLKEAGNDEDKPIQSLISGYKNYDPKNDLCCIFDSYLDDYKELYGFKCDKNKIPKTYKFVKLKFSSYTAMCKYSEAIRKKYSLLKRQTNKKYHALFKEWIEMEKDCVCDSNLYESNIHPIIKFIHERDIQPANWIHIDVNEEEQITRAQPFPEIDFIIDDIDYKSIEPKITDSISPYVLASFDIECDSSHGDFPVPTKDFKKLAIEVYDTFHKDIAGDEQSYGIRYQGFIPMLIKGAFDKNLNHTLQSGHSYISMVYTKGNKEPSAKSTKAIVKHFSNPEFRDRFLNIKERDKVIKEINEIMIDNFTKIDKIEVEGDPVIQIGTVFHKYGDEKPYKRHILVIAPPDKPDEAICDPLTEYEIDVVPCKNEKELLLKWTDIMKTEDPDFVTGYNIFGFDFGYMLDRMSIYCCKCNGCNKRYCEDNCPKNKFLNMGKINSVGWATCYDRNKKCVEKKIKTSSFGSVDYNRYLHMDGRIIFDLQKEVEKGHNLESYKLDNVAAHFMRGKIKKIESNKVTTKSRSQSKTKLITNEFGHLKVGDYVSLKVHSNIGENYYNNGHKYKIESINKSATDSSESYILLKNVYMKFYETKEGKLQKSLWEPCTSEFFKIEWCLKKDDVSPQDIFEKHKSGGPAGRAEVAKYCIQDCELCINLALNLDIIPNNIAMANVCSVPQSYIYLRGQGAKIFSLIAKECDKNGIRIPTLERPFNPHDELKEFKEKIKDDSFTDLINNETEEFKLKYFLIDNECKRWTDYETPSIKTIKQEFDDFDNMIKGKLIYIDEEAVEESNKPYEIYKVMNKYDEIMNPPPRAGYEGAIVLDPEPGIYLEDPVGVVDYASLYPSSIIEKNISHDTLIEDPKYLDYLGEGGYETITYANYIYEEDSKKLCEEKPTITCHFLKRKADEPLGIIGSVVQHLLQQRKATKKRLKNETNDFKKKVLDGLQLSYKLVANSVYGQMGARTSPIYKNKLAACTTAIGRERIYDAKYGVQGNKDTGTNGWWDSDEAKIGGKCLGVVEAPKVIYGDTDSVFIKWSRKRLIDDKIVELKGKEALQYAIDCGQAAGEWVTKNKLNMTFEEDSNIKKPQDLEYEKTFYPFILISKKRYVADKYEFDINECKRNSMGIVLKRRDNAPIVKHVFGNVIEKIMIDKDLDKSISWLEKTLKDIRDEKFQMNNFIITKSLRGYYKNPQGIAHKVLADRMGERDPGNKPKAGDRMPFAYVILDDELLYDKSNPYKSGVRKGKPRHRKVLQGDRIEDPKYIEKNNLKLDYNFYITNQIMNPVKQVLDLGKDSKETEKIFQ